MELYPDSGYKNLFYFACLLCVSLPGTISRGDCRNAICYLFCETVPWTPTSKRQACLWRCGCLWELTGNLAHGANADPKQVGQMSTHTPAFCRWLPTEMSNTMMWWAAAGALSAQYWEVVIHTNAHANTHIHTHWITSKAVALWLPNGWLPVPLNLPPHIYTHIHKHTQIRIKKTAQSPWFSFRLERSPVSCTTLIIFALFNSPYCLISTTR